MPRLVVPNTSGLRLPLYYTTPLSISLIPCPCPCLLACLSQTRTDGSCALPVPYAVPQSQPLAVSDLQYTVAVHQGDVLRRIMTTVDWS